LGKCEVEEMKVRAGFFGLFSMVTRKEVFRK